MKKSIFLILGICGLTACAGFQTQRPQQSDWSGQNFDHFVVTYGIPTSQHTLQNGNIAYSFVKQCPYTNGQDEIVVVVNQENIINGVSRVGSCPSATQEKQHNEYVDPQTNFLKEQAAKQEKENQERRKQMLKRINSLKSELFNLDYDSSYELAVSGTEHKLKLKQDSYLQWEATYKKHKEELSQFKIQVGKYGGESERILSNTLEKEKERLDAQYLDIQNVKKELEQAQTNLKDWENRRASLRKEIAILESQLPPEQKDGYEILLEKLF